MNSRATTATRISVIPVLIALLLNIFMVAPIASPPANSTLALTGSTFNATDGNMDGPNDWCGPLTATGTPDPERNTGDDSFKSSAENDAVPEIDVDSISNSTDYKQVYAASETVGGQLFAYVSFIRWDTNGTGTFSFELNQSGLLTSNGVTYQRTQGDMLLEFNFQKSADNWVVTLTYRTWNGNATSGAWSAAVSMGGFAEGSVNAATIENCLDGDDSLASGAFGEFAVNLTTLLGGDCKAFGSITAKSRASNTVTSALDDLAGPIPVNFTNCGQITINKVDDGQHPVGGATFSITPNPYTKTGSLSVTDNAAPDDNAADGVIHLTEVEPGSYTVCETGVPAGYIGDPDCQTLEVAALAAVSYTFVNGLGDISWTKIDSQTDALICCATFTLAGAAGDPVTDGFSLNVTDNGAGDEDPDAGELLVTDLLLGDYMITEITPPANYDLPAVASQDVTLAGETAWAELAFEDPPQADASIEKKAELETIVAGEDAVFTITVTAGGTGTSEDVVLTDVNETGHDWAVSGDDSATCGEDLTIEAGDTLTCDFGDVPNAEHRTVTITMDSDADDCENGIANTASVASTNDHDASDNESSTDVEVLCPNPGVTKKADVSPIVFGDDAVFNITVSAGGSGDAENVVLTDVNETGHDWTVSVANGACGADLLIEAGDTLTCTWASITPPDTRTVTITMASSEANCDVDIANTASITADADVDETNNSDTASIAVLCPNPNVLKSAEVTPVTAGDDASFDITVTAAGEGNSEGVVLTDVNETGHTWTVSGADAGDCGADLTIEAGDTLTCDFGTIPNPGSRAITITMASDAGDCANGISNTASIVADADTDLVDNTSSAHIDVLCPDLEIEKTTDTPSVNADDEVHYTVTVSNDGDAEARDVVITDDLPDGLTWTEDSADCVIDSNGDLLCQDLEAPNGLTILAEGSFSVTLTGTTDSGDCPSVENTAQFESSNGGSGSSDSDRRGATVIDVNCPDMVVIKEQVDENGEPTTEPVSAGDTAYFAIHVFNIGDGTAYGVDVVDLAPNGTIWTVVDDGGFTCPETIGDAGGTCTAEIFGVGDTTIILSYETAAADCGQLLNNVTVSAGNEPSAWVTEENSDAATIIVECPGLNIIKRQVDENGDPTNDPILAGDTAYFEILVWNSDDEGIGTAKDVVVTEDAEDLPDGVSWDIESSQGSCASSVATDQPQSFSCDLGDIEPGGSVSIIVSGETDRADCGALVNTARVDASNNDDEVPDATATIFVSCPEIALDKENDAVGSVLPGTTVEYALTLTVSDEGLENGEATDVRVYDELPVGLEDPTDISDGGTYDPASRTITWLLGNLSEEGSPYELTYDATVADDVENGEELVNAAAATSTNTPCPDVETLRPDCTDDSTVIVRVPTLVIDKVADATVITISGPNNALVAFPSVVTWTLTYTLTNGPVTNAVITDTVPAGFVFLDASDGGTETDGVVTWILASPLEASGSVTFRTTVDPETISRTGPTVNVAVIDSDQTPEDEGEDSVTVTVEPPPLGGNPTPKPSLPNTASGIGLNGEPITVPIELLVAFFIASLGALTLVNVKARSRRR